MDGGGLTYVGRSVMGDAAGVSDGLAISFTCLQCAAVRALRRRVWGVSPGGAGSGGRLIDKREEGQQGELWPAAAPAQYWGAQ